MHVFLIRHAESLNNAAAETQPTRAAANRHADPALTAAGRRQAEKLAWRMAGGGLGRLDELRTSPMLRAIETAAAIAAAAPMRTVVDCDIHENGGLGRQTDGVTVDRRGLRGAEIREFLPGATLDARIEPTGWWRSRREDGPAKRVRCTRVCNALRSRAHDEPDARIAIVGHAGFTSRMVGDLLGLPPKAVSFRLDNAAICEIELGGDRPILHRHNDVTHLADTDLDGAASPP